LARPLAPQANVARAPAPFRNRRPCVCALTTGSPRSPLPTSTTPSPTCSAEAMQKLQGPRPSFFRSKPSQLPSCVFQAFSILKLRDCIFNLAHAFTFMFFRVFPVLIRLSESHNHSDSVLNKQHQFTGRVPFSCVCVRA